MTRTEMAQSGFEPAVVKFMPSYDDLDGICLASIAISLKRIADAVSGDQIAEQFGGLTNLAWEIGRSFEAGRRTDR